ncbi:NACHT domain-containing NTPase [Myxococcus sp. CA039A]|uniref:NACHT domain-containing protein n=1 Tax=Myxococcus sp. CA039A TaxID=2741737 RepID=UPI00157A7FE3|nr:hypothetical protein [Myxococcus sp. CA039A]NTX51854.1 hypothetical protein [Myxococcus sp. CA039A]
MELRFEVNHCGCWDDLFERRTEDPQGNRHVWQVKRQTDELAEEEMRKLIRDLTLDTFDMAHLVLHSIVKVKGVEHLRFLRDLADKVRTPGLVLTDLSISLSEGEKTWCDFICSELKLPRHADALSVLKRLEIRALGSEQDLEDGAFKVLRERFVQPDMVWNAMLGVLHRYPNAAIPITYSFLDERILRNFERATSVRARSLARQRERCLEKLEHAWGELRPLRVGLGHDEADAPVRLEAVFVMPPVRVLKQVSARPPGESTDRMVAQPPSASPFAQAEVDAGHIDLYRHLQKELRLRTRPLIVVEGEMGAGKSVLLEYLLHELARYARQDEKAPVPILVDAAALVSGRLVDAIHRRTPETYDEALLKNDDMPKFFMVDGLDETSEAIHPSLQGMLSHLHSRRDSAGLIVASRPLGGAAPRPGRPHLKVKLEKWDEASLNRHLDRWSEHRHGLVARLKQDVQPDLLRPLLQNPLMATFCLYLAQEEPAALKRGRAGIFESIIRLLCERWVGGRSLEAGLSGVSWHEVAPFLRQLALAALQGQEQQVSREDLLRLLARIAPDLKERLLRLMQEKFGLLVRQEDGSYRFVLRGVAEHLSGAELRRLGVDAIVKAAREKWAEEPVRHAIGLIAELDSLPQALAVIDQLLVPQDNRDGLRFLRSQLTAVRTATDLPVQDGPTVARLTQTLAGMLAHESSSWLPRRAEQVLDEWSLARDALRRAVGARLLELLRIPGKRANWWAARENDSANYWLLVLEERDPEVRLVALQRLARWVDVNAVRNALLDSLHDWEEPYPRYPPAILAGQVLRCASRDGYFEATLPELRDLMRRQHSKSSLAASLALRPGEAPAEELAAQLHTLAQRYGCPLEVVSELASRDDGRRALEAVWADWQGPMNLLPQLPMPSDESAREPIPPPSSLVKERLIHLLGAELSQLELAERERLVPLNSFAAAPSFLRAASDYPEGTLWLIAHLREVFFLWEDQRRLGEAAVRHPLIQRALLAHCAGMEDSKAYNFPGLALDVLVAADNEDAAVHLATWIRTNSQLRLLREPMSREALLHPRVREAAVARMESEWEQATVPNERGGVRPITHAAAVFRALRPVLEGTELEARWVVLAREWTAQLTEREEVSSVSRSTLDQLCAAALIISFWNPPHPLEVQDALAAYVAVLSRGDEELQSGIAGGAHWAAGAGCLELMRPSLETCSTRESWLRYTCSAFLVSLLGRDEAAVLSGKLACEWPDFWSPAFNAPVELEQLIAANPEAWNRRVHELGEEYLRALTLQGLPIGHVSRALMRHLSRGDQLGLAQLLFSCMKHSHHPWLNPDSMRPANAYRPGEPVLELLFDVGLSPG